MGGAAGIFLVTWILKHQRRQEGGVLHAELSDETHERMIKTASALKPAYDAVRETLRQPNIQREVRR